MEITTQMTKPCHRLMKARRMAGYRSARAAASALDVKPATYAAHENGSRTFSISDARRYAELYSVSPGWILTGEVFERGHYSNVSDEPIAEDINETTPQQTSVNIDSDEPVSERDILNFGKQALELLKRIAPPAEPTSSRDTITVGEVFIKSMVQDNVDPDEEQWEFSDQWQFPSRYILDVLKVAPNDVAILIMIDDNMSPTYEAGDHLIINFQLKGFTGDGVYFFLTEDRIIHIQNVQCTNGQYKLSNDSSAESTKHPTRTVGKTSIDFQGKICGVIKAYQK
jgi:phage repressor protein C with HTH and peptisase S24 domain